MGHQPDAEAPRHHPDARKGEEIVRDEGVEPGRRDREPTGAGRPAGERDGRDSTRVNPTQPVDPASPKMPPQ